MVTLGVTPIDAGLAAELLAGLADFGYAEGRNVRIEHRHAEGHNERLVEIAAELVKSDVRVVFVRGAGALTAASRATTTIPIVAVDWRPTRSRAGSSGTSPSPTAT